MSSSKDKAAESKSAIEAVDAVLAGVGLTHGRRATRAGTWKGGERVPRVPLRSNQKLEQPAAPGFVPVEAWKDLPWVRAGFSTRQGGFSTSYGDLEQNMGFTREDEAATVLSNRERFVRAVVGGEVIETKELVTIRQFHGNMVRDIKNGKGLKTADNKAVLRADGMMTALPGLLLGIQTADCVPVLLVDSKGHVVAALHAGWRGTLARIVEHSVGTLRLNYGSRTVDLRAAIGPCIGACCFAVGEEVRHDFESQFAYAPGLFSEVYDSDPVREKYPLLFLTARAPGHSNIGPQLHLDLVEANRRQLVDAGVPEGNISVVGECTACTRLRKGTRKYFSHRAEHGFTGRMLSVVGMVG